MEKKFAYFFEAMDRGTTKLTNLVVSEKSFKILSETGLIPILDKLRGNGVIERMRDEFI